MGVSGSGKTTIGIQLANLLKNAKYEDGDDFHTESNKDKMRNKLPLNDDDRYPWLTILNNRIYDNNLDVELKDCIYIISCSALKQSYRNIITGNNNDYISNNNNNNTNSIKNNNNVIFLYLKCSKDVLLERLTNRLNHFMPIELLDSQYDTLEEPYLDSNNQVFVVNGDKNIKDIMIETMKFFYQT
jgi:gluconokinase